MQAVASANAAIGPYQRRRTNFALKGCEAAARGGKSFIYQGMIDNEAFMRKSGAASYHGSLAR